VSQLYSAYFFFLFVFQCTPISNFWNQYRGGVGHCINPSITVASFYGYSAISCATDWTFSIVPIFMVWNLQMDRKTKISVAFMLAFAAMYVPSPSTSYARRFCVVPTYKFPRQILIPS
jgi:hypothetical protein